MSQLLEKIEAIISPLLSPVSYELVDLTYQKGHGGWTLCLYIDKAGGVTLDDCEKCSRIVEEALDRENVIGDAYVLEVSSPGLDRPLKKTADFERYAGQKVQIKLFAPLNGQKNFQGVLVAGDDTEIRVRFDGREVVIPRSQIARAKLDPEISF